VLKFKVVASGDALEAKLSIHEFTQEEWRSAWLGPTGLDGPVKLRAFLESQGILPACIREHALKWIAETLTDSSETTRSQDILAAEGMNVAEGNAPFHEEPQGLTFHHAYLSNSEAIAELRRKADAWGFGGIRESIDPTYWVSSGATVLSFQAKVSGIPGQDIYGMPIPFLTLRERLPAFGKSLFLKEKSLIAVCDGALIIEEGLLKVLGADSLPTCQVVISEDKMTANLVLGGNYLNDWSVTLDMVQSAMREQKVASKIPESDIIAALQKFNLDHLPLTLMIARGLPASPGLNGRVVMLVDPEPEVPMPGADGSIDFKNFSFFRTVTIGTRLARIEPPTPGQSGLSVCGEIIEPPEAKPFASEPGRNTELMGFDPLFLVASTSGRLAVNHGIPEVVEVLDVSGDVSLKTGNIEFPGAVKVAGDVHNKMEIEAIGDVEVVGTVEDSVIRSDGAIVIKGGVNGLGHGIIKSRLSSVTIGYLHNQRIESYSHIVVFNEIINSHLLARKTISMRYGKYAVLGGHLLAGEGMDLFNVGSEAGSKTILEVGKDFEVEAQITEKTAQLLSHSQDLGFLRDMDDQLVHMMRLRRNPSDEDIMLQKRTQGAIENLERWMGTLRQELGELSKRLYSQEYCEILIRGSVYPGTVIKYREHVLIVPTKLTHRKWLFSPNAVLPPPEGRGALI
jgi:uncharacterized protein